MHFILPNDWRALGFNRRNALGCMRLEGKTEGPFREERRHQHAYLSLPPKRCLGRLCTDFLYVSAASTGARGSGQKRVENAGKDVLGRKNPLRSRCPPTSDAGPRKGSVAGRGLTGSAASIGGGKSPPRHGIAERIGSGSSPWPAPLLPSTPFAGVVA